MADSHEPPELELPDVEIEDDDEADDTPPPCWCGEQDPHHDVSVYEQTCGGLGTLECRCGGDQCVCHNHGEVQCDGCEDCRDPDALDGFDEDGEELPDDSDADADTDGFAYGAEE